MAPESHPRIDPASDPLEQITQLSRFYGANPEFVLAGGGNTSVKVEGCLYIKASGVPLATITPDGFVKLDRQRVRGILDQSFSEDPMRRESEILAELMAARLEPERGQRPSVETVLHELLCCRYVVHTHATAVNQLTCSVKGPQLARELFGDEALWVDYVDPGYILAKSVESALRSWRERTGRECPQVVLLQNHGLIVCADEAEEVLRATDALMERLSADGGRAAEPGSPGAFGPVVRLPEQEARAALKALGPSLRAALAEERTLKIVTFDDSDVALELAGAQRGAEVAGRGPLSPDQIVYCKSFPLWLETRPEESGEQLADRVKAEVEAHRSRTGFNPKVVLVKGLGLFAAGDTIAQASTVRDVYKDAIKVMAGAERLGGIKYLSQREREFIDTWEVEQYRRKVASAAGGGRVRHKVAVVTGAAQGFGQEIAQDLVREGAHVAFCDLNLAGARASADAVAEECGAGRALGVAMDVTKSESVAEALYQVVRAYGGVDLFISNAGILKAGSVMNQPPQEFRLVTEVNYVGYFVCVQQVAPILALQHRVRPDAQADIIQINSKSGLVGSNKNGAYAGSKFGGIGLTQSFALELVEHGVKVNSICPGNFFDGPLWSDPENGLFVQYLRTGKVPGARTIEDVKRFYEEKVPMKRGCRSRDVLRALYYLIEQEYETGQAVPVTGGQVMLS